MEQMQVVGAAAACGIHAKQIFSVRFTPIVIHLQVLKLLDLRENELSNEWCAVLVRANETGMGRVIQL